MNLPPEVLAAIEALAKNWGVRSVATQHMMQIAVLATELAAARVPEGMVLVPITTLEAICVELHLLEKLTSILVTAHENAAEKP